MDQRLIQITKTLKEERKVTPAAFKKHESRYHYHVDYSLSFFEKEDCLDHYKGIIEKIKFTGGKKLLDVGCGSGHWCLAALDFNTEVHGIDRGAEFIHLNKAYTKSLGLEDRLIFKEGPAENIGYEDSYFDYVVCHGVLQFTDHELTFDCISNTLKTDGLFYLGYTAEGLRVSSTIQEHLPAQNYKMAHTQLSILLTQEAYAAGVFALPFGQTLGHTFDEVQRMMKYSGLDLVHRPDLQDASGMYHGHEKTCDCVVRKVRESTEKQALLLAEFKESGLNARSFLLDLLKCGLPHLVQRCIHERWISISATDAAFVLALAKLKLRKNVVGLSSLPPLKKVAKLTMWKRMMRLFSRPAGEMSAADKDIINGLTAISLKQYDEAIEHFKKTLSNKEWRYGEFMIACALLLKKNYPQASSAFKALSDKNSLSFVGWAGQMLCALETEKYVEATDLGVKFDKTLSVNTSQKAA